MSECKYCGNNCAKPFCSEVHKVFYFEHLIDRIDRADDFLEAKSGIVELLRELIKDET